MLKYLTSKHTNSSALKNGLFIIITFIVGIIIFSLFPPQAVDWHNTFYPVSNTLLQPYTIKTFLNLPWITLILFPFSFFSENISLVFNASLNMVVFGSLIIFKKGNSLSLFLTLSSFPFLASISNGAVEWIPAVGFLFPNAFGIILVLTKPQSGFLVGIDWFYHQKNKIKFIGIPILLIIISFFIWNGWPHDLISNSRQVNLQAWNISLFPWSIPIGLVLMFFIVKKRPDNGELLGTLATICFVPYFAPHSLTILFALLSIYHPRGSIAFWLILWIYPISQNISFYSQLFGF